MTGLTNRQVDLLEQLDDYVEWIECYGHINEKDVSYIQGLIDNLAKSIVETKERNELAEKCPWTETD